MAEQATQDRPKSKTGKARRRDPWRTIKDHLSGQAPETLIELLLEVAQRDDQLYQLLLLKAERFGGDGNTFKAFRRAIKHATHIPQPMAPNYSLRVEIALWEKGLEAAWVAASTGSCHRSLLLTLAGKLEPSRPNDAISLYRRVVPIIVEETNNAAYAEAINLIRKLGRLMKAQHQLRQFSDYRAELRTRFKPKRNFIKLLDGLK